MVATIISSLRVPFFLFKEIIIKKEKTKTYSHSSYVHVCAFKNSTPLVTNCANSL